MNRAEKVLSIGGLLMNEGTISKAKEFNGCRAFDRPLYLLDKEYTINMRLVDGVFKIPELSTNEVTVLAVYGELKFTHAINSIYDVKNDIRYVYIIVEKMYKEYILGDINSIPIFEKAVGKERSILVFLFTLGFLPYTEEKYCKKYIKENYKMATSKAGKLVRGFLDNSIGTDALLEEISIDGELVNELKYQYK